MNLTDPRYFNSNGWEYTDPKQPAVPPIQMRRPSSPSRRAASQTPITLFKRSNMRIDQFEDDAECDLSPSPRYEDVPIGLINSPLN